MFFLCFFNNASTLRVFSPRGAFGAPLCFGEEKGKWGRAEEGCASLNMRMARGGYAGVWLSEMC